MPNRIFLAKASILVRRIPQECYRAAASLLSRPTCSRDPACGADAASLVEAQARAQAMPSFLSGWLVMRPVGAR